MRATQEPATATEVNPGPLIKLTIADCAARVLHSAVQLGVFDVLANGPATETQLREQTGLHPRMSADFLDALVGLGLLTRAAGRYCNGLLASTYLIRGQEGYLGDFLELTNETLYDTWAQLTDALCTGEPQHLNPDKGGFVGTRHTDPAKMKRFLAGMDAFSDCIGRKLSASVDWSAYRSFVDVGGARGNLASVLVDAYPHLRATCFDLPRTQPLFEEHVRRLGLRDRIRFVAGDFFADPLPEADVLVLGHILHGLDTAQRRTLLAQVFAAVRPGGAVLIFDRMIDHARSDADRLLSSLHMRLVSQHGAEYRIADCQRWLREVGFTSSSAAPLFGTHTLVVGQR